MEDGYTITLSFENYKISYCHVSQLILVSVGDTVFKGQVLGYVGPKNVYGVSGNTYKDENRQSNKWSNYWSSSSFRCSI